MSSSFKIFAHDAAAANATFAFALERVRDGDTVQAFPSGPAAAIYQAQIPSLVVQGAPVFSVADTVVTGLSGPHTNYELNAIRDARRARVSKIIAILDIPFNVDTRLTREGHVVSDEFLPDEIWIPSAPSGAQGAGSSDPKIAARLKERENPYWAFLKASRYSSTPPIQDPALQAIAGKYLLYVTDYIEESWGKSLGFTEFTVLKEFLDACRKHSRFAVVIRPHPAEAPGKYDAFLAEYSDLDIRQSPEPLHSLLFHSRAVFGALSSVFYECALIGKPSYSIQIDGVSPRTHLAKGVQILLDRDSLSREIDRVLKSEQKKV